MKRNLWRRMEQNPPHNARESGCQTWSILHHEFRFMSHSLYLSILLKQSLPLLSSVKAYVTRVTPSLVLVVRKESSRNPEDPEF